jgi:PIN domain nuclease of toxin-antitoxin system
MWYVVDTHALIWFLTGDPRLGIESKRVLSDPKSRLIIPTIVLAEAKHISDRKRVAISFDAIMRAIGSSARITVLPLDIFLLAYLPAELDIHDSLIVASARNVREMFSDEVVILTKDEAISNSGLIKTTW